jgi:hypothetical protein
MSKELEEKLINQLYFWVDKVGLELEEREKVVNMIYIKIKEVIIVNKIYEGLYIHLKVCTYDYLLLDDNYNSIIINTCNEKVLILVDNIWFKDFFNNVDSSKIYVEIKHIFL